MDWKHCERRQREKEKVELEQGAEWFMLIEVQGKCRPHSRVQCWLKPVVKVKA